MRVRDLIAILQHTDSNAEVFIMSQPQWPMEYSVAGVAVRGDFADAEEEDEEDEEGGDAEGDLRPNDVFILEGSQERYGSREAWRARARRR
jgi:hypothetical protein